MDIIKDIQDVYPNLSHQEKNVAKFILQNNDQVPNISIVELAKRSNTSPSTVSRLIKKLDFENFVEFKIAFTTSSHKISLDDIAGTEKEREIYEYYTKAISNTRILNKESAFENVASAIRRSKKVYIIGIGSSGFTAEEFARRLMRMGKDSVAITESNLMYIMSSLFTENDLLIAISISGTTREIKETLTIAKNTGMTSVALTSFRNSEVAKLCNHILLSYNTNFIDEEIFINSQFSIGYLIDVITSLLLENEDYRKAMNKTIQQISHLYINE